jgi:parvulin-like peptidyl-prolyl isomerase
MQRALMRDKAQFLEDAIRGALIRHGAAEHGIAASRNELQSAANAFREKHRLLKAENMMQWLEDRRLSVTDWQGVVEEEVLAEKIKLTLFRPKVATYFAEHKLEFDVASIGRILVANEGLARELILQLIEEGASFEDLARRHSTDSKTKDLGGYAGRVTRKDLGPAASSAVFGAQAKATLGPFRSGKDVHIYRVIELHPSVLDDATQERIENVLFEEWLNKAREAAGVEIPLLDREQALAEVG